MPYISPESREKFITSCDALAELIEAKGELNFVVSRILHMVVQKKGMSYTNASEFMGALTDAAMEFYRQVLAPYEDRKKKENGPVSGLDGAFFEKVT